MLKNLSDKITEKIGEIGDSIKNASRLNVIDHGNKNKLIEDAKRLVDYLGVPIWEGSRY